MRYQLADSVSKNARTQTKSKINDLVEAQAKIGCNSFEIEFERFLLMLRYGGEATKIKLKSLILAQIERWRHA